jgi:hypothetical protein
MGYSELRGGRPAIILASADLHIAITLVNLFLDKTQKQDDGHLQDGAKGRLTFNVQRHH